MAFSERIVKHRSVFEVKPVSHNPPGINDFEIIKPISKGAFGQVYLAHRKDSDKLYALKAMKKIDVLNKNMMEQVVVERDALAISSKSSFVVQLYYSFQNRENIFLVMEYMIGGDLKSLLHNVGFFDEDMARFYVAEVTLALEYLHSYSIFHCDIKPDNLLLSSGGHVKLTDFGLSTLSSSSKLTKQSIKPDKLFWRTPGQLESLVCKFTFSSPKPNQRIEKKRLGSFYKKNIEFELSTPGRVSYSTTPCGLQRRNKCSSSAIYENEPSKLSFSSFEKDEKDDINNRSRKRTMGIMNTVKEKENIPKRFRSSLPAELESAFDQSKGDFKGTVETNSNDLEFSRPADIGSFVENMSVDLSVFSCDDNHNKSENNNLSGVSILPESESSMMSVSCSSEHHFDKTYTVPAQDKRKSVLKENVKWCENSPHVMGTVRHDEVRFQTPVKNLNFNLEEDGAATELHSSNVSDESVNLENSVSTLHDTPSCEIFSMPFLNQTPFRTPKSCVRGKVAITEKRRIQGTPDYLAPEILLKQEFGAPADWWALGVCYYEFVTGVPPFNDDTPELVFQHILDHEMIWPEGEESLDESTVDSIEWMLSMDPSERPVADEIKKLSSFSHFKWDNLQNEPAPFIPQPDDKYDTTYFDAKNIARQFKMSDYNI